MDSPRSSQTLRLNLLSDDILYLVIQATQRSQKFNGLQSISRASRRLRLLCMPILFKQCYLNYSPHAIPPEVIRAHVRRVTYYGIGPTRRITTPYATSLHTYLNHLPNVVHIRLLGIDGGPSAELMNLCLEKAISLDIDVSSRWLPIPSDLPSGEHYTSRNSLTHFHYGTHTSRELLNVGIQ
ncbi:hypothetical protein GY45DRAFT_793506 [Cubamyces sp. BRFM 1775]|nr:hypothetical protein GY45DRAFT_793506 [Cubamyces sp. BRFM 1775]